MTSLTKNLTNLSTALSCPIKMIVRNEIVLVRQLTLYPLGVCNMFQIRHLPLTLSMFLVLMMIMIVLLTFNCHTAPIGPPNQSYEMVILILFLFIALWGIYLLTLRVSRSLWFVWPNTLRIKFNNIEEFKGFGEAAWRFISTIYNSE